jgi:hypothetical protein
MVEDFDEIGSWPGRGDWHGRAEHTRPARPTSPISGSMCAGFVLSERCHAPIFVTGA